MLQRAMLLAEESKLPDWLLFSAILRHSNKWRDYLCGIWRRRILSDNIHRIPCWWGVLQSIGVGWLWCCQNTIR